MAMPFEVYTDHYALQWLKTMRTGSALLHRWSAALEGLSRMLMRSVDSQWVQHRLKICCYTYR